MHTSRQLPGRRCHPTEGQVILEVILPTQLTYWMVPLELYQHDNSIFTDHLPADRSKIVKFHQC